LHKSILKILFSINEACAAQDLTENLVDYTGAGDT